MANVVNIPKGVILIGGAVGLVIPVVDLNGDWVDISAYSMDWQLRADASVPTAALITKTTALGAITVISALGGTNNCAVVALVAGDTWVSPTIMVPQGEYDHALRRKDDNVIIAYGKAWVLAQSGLT